MVEEARVLDSIASLHREIEALAELQVEVASAMVDVHQVVQRVIAESAAVGQAVGALHAQEGLAGAWPQQLLDDAVGKLSDIDQAAAALDTQIDALGNRVVEVASGASDCFVQVGDAAEAALQKLNEGVDESIQKIGQAGTALGQASDALVDRIDDVQDQIDELLNALEERVGAVSQPAAEMLERCSDALDALAQRVLEEVMPAEVEKIAADVAAALKNALEQALELLCDGIDAFAGQIVECGDRGNETRATIQPALDQFRDAIDPALAELDRIRGLAGSVGIPI
jgi:hypothetical protein